MKTAKDPRHQTRIEAVKTLFANSFSKQENISSLTEKVIKDKDIVDEKIVKAAPAWPIEKLNRIDLAILRLAVYELIEKAAPPKVIIDEAVEIAKRYGSENSASFINGVLGTILKDMDLKNEKG